ncbi:hypothetical protein [Nonomuraea sp. NPDC049695]|uniref:hypothetical protein n=1 Tax=Nonomuraea sp. NPDC049695 TaxID=3154734 RepID=UPI003423457B
MPLRARPVLIVTLTALPLIAAAAVVSYVSVSVSDASPAEPVPAAMSLPFDAYELSQFDVHTIEAAQDVLIGACMREQGLTWQSLPAPTAAGTRSPHARRYGIMDAGDAGRYGYHLPSPSPTQARRDAVWAAREKLPATEKLALDGAKGHGGGCRGRARAQVTGKAPQDWLEPLNRYASQTFEAAQRAPEVVAVIREWSACMKEAGYPYPGPFEAVGDGTWWKTQQPSDRERAVARADMRCKQETDLIPIWAEADRRVQLGVLRQHAGEFRRMAEAKKALLDLARDTLRQA